MKINADKDLPWLVSDEAFPIFRHEAEIAKKPKQVSPPDAG